MSRKHGRKKKTVKQVPKESTPLLNALSEVKSLQNNTVGGIQSLTVADSESPTRSVGSNDLHQDDLTGGSLQWYEKLQDEKLNSVEARIDAQTTEMVLGVKSDLEGKIANIKDSALKYIIGIIFSMVLAFIGFYFSALMSIENKVESRLSVDIKEIRKQVTDLDKEMTTKITDLFVMHDKENKL